MLDFSQGMSGPLAAMILADHGAEVVKVEPPWGDWARELPGYLMWNRGKQIMTLDLRDERDLRPGPARLLKRRTSWSTTGALDRQPSVGSTGSRWRR